MTKKKLHIVVWGTTYEEFINGTAKYEDDGVIKDTPLISYLESVESEFARHFTYTDGKEHAIWGTALNRVVEALIIAKREKS